MLADDLCCGNFQNSASSMNFRSSGALTCACRVLQFSASTEGILRSVSCFVHLCLSGTMITVVLDFRRNWSDSL